MVTKPRPGSRGWKGAKTLLEDPIPGDPMKCLDELGVEIIRVDNDEALGRCPAHIRLTGKQDRHPSWSVNLESGRHNCFSCGFKGPFYLIVKEVIGGSNEDAIAWVKARGSIDRAKKILFGEGVFVNELAEQYTEADLALFTEVPEYACNQRDLSPHAVDHYGILWDAEHARWITPIREPFTNRLLGYQEKGHHDRYFRNRPQHLEKGKALFGLKEFQGDTAAVVESPLDVPKIYQALDEPIGLSTMGVQITDDQIDIMVEAGVKVLVSALDNDRDGMKANDQLRHRVRGRLLLRYWDYGDTDAKDPGEQEDYDLCQSYVNAYSSVLWKK